MAEQFNAVILKNGEKRREYIARRLFLDGATREQVLAEINSPELFSGEPGKLWRRNIVDEVAGSEKEEAKLFEREQEKVLGAIATEIELSEDELAQIREEAKALVVKELKAKKKKSLLAQEKERLEGELAGFVDPNKELVDVYIDLAPYAPFLRINMGTASERVYWHGQTYRVTREVADTLRSMVAQTWRHQAEVDGKKKDFYRERGAMISARDNSITYHEGLRV